MLEKKVENFKKWFLLSSDLKIVFLEYILVVIIRMLTNLPFAVPYTNGDEYMMIAVPAKLAGLDWHNLLSLFYRYYGPGFTIISYPLFLSGIPMTIIYRILVLFEMLIGSLSVFIFYYMLKVFFDLKKSIIILLSFTAGFIPFVSYVFLYNENPYGTWVSLSFFLILCLAKYRKLWQQMLLSLLFVCSFLLALSVHQRAITLIICFVITYFSFLIVYKKRLGSLTIICGGSYLIYRANMYLIGLQYDLLFPKTTNEVTSLGNVSVDTSIDFSFVFSFDYIANAFRTLIGILTYNNFLFIGLSYFVLLFGLYFLCCKEDDSKMYYWLIYVYGMVSMVITFGGQYNSWSSGLVQAINGGDYENDSLRLLTYARYTYPYYVPVFVCTIGVFAEKSKITQRIKRLYLMGMAFLFFVWLKSVYVLFAGSSSNTSRKLRQIVEDYSLGMIKEEQVYILNIFVVFIILFLFVNYLLSIKSKEHFVLLLCLALIVIRTNSDLGQGVFKYENYYKRFNNTVSFMQNAPQEIGEIAMYTPLYDIESTRQCLGAMLQLYLYKYTLNFGYPKQSVNEAIVFDYDDSRKKSLTKMGYKTLIISDRQLIYYKGDTAEEILSNMYEEWKK